MSKNIIFILMYHRQKLLDLIYRLSILKTPGKIRNPKMVTLNYNCQSLFYRLQVFDMCTSGKYMRIKLVFQLHTHILQQMERPLYTTVCTMHKWVAQKADPPQRRCTYFIHLLLLTHMIHIPFCRGVAIFLTAVPLTVNHCNCVCTKAGVI
jgi:hypothetical protein